ncbi:TraC family protein [Neorhizobium sp. DT-125]|uniref:TraC family protein n=1 Tax=Neorhizobium sp. DT-125 TaxID=3396163 RepID=UPI003F1BB6ED
MDQRNGSRKSTVSDIDAEIERLRERRKKVIMKDHGRFARAAIKAGLGELNISDDELDAAFENMVKTFRAGRTVADRAAE